MMSSRPLPDKGQEVITVKDQLGRDVQFAFPPQRIISVVPSQTELLADLDLNDQIVGLTWFCVHPEGLKAGKARVGGTKNLKFDKILALKPDIVFANKEENERAQIEELAKHVPVWVSDIANLDDALEMIRSIGACCNRKEEALSLSRSIEVSIQNFPQFPPHPTLYLIWRKPWMSVGRDTFIHHMLERLGLVNVLAHESRYPEVEPATAHPKLVLLSSEPYPFKEAHLEEVRTLWPEAEVRLVDGEMFSWYGSRLLKAVQYFSELKLV